MMKLVKLLVLLILIVALVVFFLVAAFAPHALPVGVGVSSVPLRVKAGASLVGKGMVVTVSNGTDETLRDVKIRCRDPKQPDEEKVLTIAEFKPDETVSIGWLEGWRFEQGHKLILSARGHLTRRLDVTADGVE